MDEVNTCFSHPRNRLRPAGTAWKARPRGGVWSAGWLGLGLAAMAMATPGAEAMDLQVGQYSQATLATRPYPEALRCLLAAAAETTLLQARSEPVSLESWTDPRLAACPVVYLNCAEIQSWDFDTAEREALRTWLEGGGFLVLDAGIAAEFLRSEPVRAQFHSYANWQVRPEVEQLFTGLLPEARFAPLPREHPVFRRFYQGLPDPSLLPEAIRRYVVEEKWPDGTYSLMGLYLGDQLAALACPIVAMGWERDEAGNWITRISFRVLEEAVPLEDRLPQAAYGHRYETIREDGLVDLVFCQEEGGLPSWVEEPDGRWRIFKYYAAAEISDFAHQFYTRLGTNLLLYALTPE